MKKGKIQGFFCTQAVHGLASYAQGLRALAETEDSQKVWKPAHCPIPLSLPATLGMMSLLKQLLDRLQLDSRKQ